MGVCVGVGGGGIRNSEDPNLTFLIHVTFFFIRF